MYAQVMDGFRVFEVELHYVFTTSLLMFVITFTPRPIYFRGNLTFMIVHTHTHTHTPHTHHTYTPHTHTHTTHEYSYGSNQTSEIQKLTTFETNHRHN